MQRGVGRDDPDQPDAGEVQTLGDHLRAEQHVGFARAEAVERLLVVPGGAHRVGVHADRADPREFTVEFLFNALGAQAEDAGGVAAVGTVGLKRLLGPAMMATHDPALRQSSVKVVNHRDVAVVAAHHPPAAVVRAGDVVGVAAAVEQEDGLVRVWGVGCRVSGRGAGFAGP